MSRRLAVVLGLVVLTASACSPSGAGTVTGSSSASAGPTPQGTADGVIDRLIGATRIRGAGDGLARAVTLDATGTPAVLLQPADGGIAVARVGAPSGWQTARGPGGLGADADGLDASPDGSLVATVSTDDSVEICHVAPDGQLTYVQTPDRLHLNGYRVLVPPAASPDGHTLYLAGFDTASGADQLFAVDVATGAVAGQTSLPPKTEIWSVAVTPDGQVVAGDDLPLGADRYTAVLDRFDATLHPLGETPLVAGRAPSRVFDVEVAPDGTPWATVQDHRGEARAVLQLQKIPAGAAAPVVVASWPARNYASPSSIWRGIAVDRAGANAYVLDAPGTGGDWDVTVTPIALATGTVGPAIPVATNAEPHGIVLSTDDRELYVAGQTLDGNPFLWTLG